MSQAINVPAGRPWRQRVLRSTLSLGARQALVAGLTAVGVLLLSHMLSPQEFAFFGWTTAVATIASAVGDFGLGAALIHSGRARELAPHTILRHLRLIVPLTVVSVALVVALPLSAPVKTAALLLCVSAALLGAQMLPTSVFEAEGRFAFIGAIEVVQRGVLIAGAVTMAAVYHSSWAAPSAAVAAGAFGWGTALVTSRIRFRGVRPASEQVDASFARSWLTGRVANHLNYAVYPIVGTAFLSGRGLGLVLWAVQVSAVPALGGQVVARVLFPALAGDQPAQRTATHRRTVLVLLAIGGPFVSAMIVFAGPLIRLVFGATWLGATTVLQIECFNTYLGLILTPTAPALYLFLPPPLVRTGMVVYAMLTAVLAVGLVKPVGLTAISIATAVSTTVILVVFHRLLHRHGHPGLGFVLPITMVLGATVPAGLAWAPTPRNLLGLVGAGAAWALVAFALGIALTRPPIPWRRLRAREKLTCA